MSLKKILLKILCETFHIISLEKDYLILQYIYHGPFPIHPTISHHLSLSLFFLHISGARDSPAVTAWLAFDATEFYQCGLTHCPLEVFVNLNVYYSNII